MSSKERPLYEFYFEPEAVLKTDDGLLIAQPDVSRQQYFCIESVNIKDSDDIPGARGTAFHSNGRYGTNYEGTSSDTSYPSDLDDDKESDSDSDDSDDDEELDWKCCLNHIDFLNEGPFNISNALHHHKHRHSHYNYDRHRHRHRKRGRINDDSSRSGLDDFLSDVLEETNRKKRKEAMLLTIQRRNKSHLLNAPHSIPTPFTLNRNAFKSSFSGSHQTPLCRRCKHIFVEPKVDGMCLTPSRFLSLSLSHSLFLSLSISTVAIR